MTGAPKTPLLTVDCVVFDGTGRVVLIRRKYPPFQHGFALPGGFVDIGERVEDACRRELLEETGLIAADIKLVGVYSDPSRDVRRHTVSVAYVTVIVDQAPMAGDDAEAAVWVDDWQNTDIAFDHALIIADAKKRLS